MTSLIMPNNKTDILKIGLMSSGNGEGSLKLIKSINEITKKIPVNIEFIFCNREYGEHSGSDKFLEEINSYNVPIITISSKKFTKNKLVYEKKILSRLSKYNFDLILLAGYMLITKKIHNKYETYNLHPALPNGPKGKWDEVINELIDSKSSKSGLMIHKVIDEVDSGRCLTYCSFDINYSALNKEKQFLNIRKKIIGLESIFICKTLEMLSTNQIKLEGGVPSDLTNYL